MKEKKKKTIRKILIAFIVILAVFVASERVNDVARDAFDRMITFIKSQKN